MNATRSYRIGIDARFYRKETAGIGRYTRELLTHLFVIDVVNQYFVFLTEADITEWNISAPNVTPVVIKAFHYSVAEQTRFLKVLYSYKLDLVHFLNFNHPLLYNRPFVTTLHDLTLLHFRREEAPAKALIRTTGFKLTLHHALKKAKKVIAISEFSAHDAERTLGVPHPKMNVIYNGLPQPVQMLPGAKDAVRKYTGSTVPYFLFLSDWRPHKGLITLLDAFAKFKKDTGLPHKLLLCGKQTEVNEALRERMISSLAAADIIAPGFAPEDLLPALYHYAEALVVPSEYEGFGLPVLEGLMHGTVVISSDATSLPEVGGNAVLYFSSKDINGLADRLKEVADPSFNRVAYTGRAEKQLRKFSWEKCAQETLNTYLSVLEKRR